MVEGEFEIAALSGTGRTRAKGIQRRIQEKDSTWWEIMEHF